MLDYQVIRLIDTGSTKNIKFSQKYVEKEEAIHHLQKGGNIYTTEKKASALAKAMSEGKGAWRESAQIMGGYHHFQDVAHRHSGHIFYGEMLLSSPSGWTHEKLNLTM